MSRRFHPKDSVIQELVQLFEDSIVDNTNAFLQEEELEHLIEYYESVYDMNKAFMVVERGIELYAYSSNFWVKKAQMHFKSGDNTLAWEALERATVFESESSDILLLSADILTAEERYDEALVKLERLVDFVSKDEKIDVWLEIADVYDISGQQENFEATLRYVLHKAPMNEEALYRYWTMVSIREETKSSIPLFKKITHVAPYNNLAWSLLANAYEHNEMYAESIEAYEFSLAIKDEFYVSNDYAGCLQKIEEWEKAISVYHEMLALFNKDTRVHMEIAHCEVKRKNLDAAIVHFELAKKGAKRKEEKADCEYEMGTTYVTFGNHIQAITHFHNAIELRPKKGKYWNALGKAYRKLNRIEDASKCFLQSLEKSDEHPKRWLRLVSCYHELGLTDRAIEALHRAQLILPNHVKLNYAYAAHLLHHNFSQSGLLQLGHALSLDATKKNYIFVLFPELRDHDGVTQLCEQY